MLNSGESWDYSALFKSMAALPSYSYGVLNQIKYKKPTEVL